ncbi:MAG: hypothetical protein KAQ85_04420, partial [Thermodesulfovibrionia bacterium]|nr:hypothetical protein [Thermodesulfovibrionia bacterium]
MSVKKRGRKSVKIEDSFSYDKRVYEKAIGIFSSVLGVKINVQFTDSGLNNVAEIEPKEYLVSLNPHKPFIKTQKQFFRIMEHEIAHLLFKSDINIIQKFAKKMAKKYEDFGIQELQAKLSMFAIEDHRVEANWGFIYLGSKYYFNQLKSGAINRVPTDLAQLVLAARCEAEHLVHPFFRDFYNFTMSKLRETEGKTMVASVRVGDQIIEKYIETIKNFLQQKKDEEKKEKQEEEQEEGFSNGSSPDGNEPEKSDDYDPLDDIDIKDLESILDEYAEEGDVSTEEIKEEIFTRFSTEEGNYKEETRLDLGLDLDINEALSGDFDDIMGEAKRQFEEQLDAIKEKLSEFSPPSPERNIDLPVVKED